MRSFLLFFLSLGLVVVGLFFVFDLSYLLHGVRCTYLRGERSAQIDDFKFFYNRVVSSDSAIVIPRAKNYTEYISNSVLNNALVGSESTAFVVLQNDSVLLEKYWHGGGERVLSNSFSMAKSIVSLLVGCAIEDGFVSGVDQSVVDFIPELKNFEKSSPVKVKHLLEMSSGYDWLENYKRPISVTAKAYYGKNIKNLMFNRGFVSVPGEVFRYQSGDTQLLGIFLERAVGESLSRYASRVLWSKIGATKDALWTLDSKGGSEKAFCCFNSTALDFAKIGLLMLNNGQVGGVRVVNSEYIDWLLDVPELVFEKKDNSDSTRVIKHYSNSWYLAELLNKRVFYAKGFLGQYIVIIPELNLVFVRLGKNEDPKSSQNNEYLLTNNLKLFIEQVILDFNN